MSRGYEAAADHLGGEERKPEKVVHHVEVRHSSTKGDHVITHHHTHPEHHPPETHTTRGDDEMTDHMLSTMGNPNPGESAADAGTPDMSGGAAGAAGAGAAPVPAPGAAPMMGA